MQFEGDGDQHAFANRIGFEVGALKRYLWPRVLDVVVDTYIVIEARVDDTARRR